MLSEHASIRAEQGSLDAAYRVLEEAFDQRGPTTFVAVPLPAAARSAGLAGSSQIEIGFGAIAIRVREDFDVEQLAPHPRRRVKTLCRRRWPMGYGTPAS